MPIRQRLLPVLCLQRLALSVASASRVRPRGVFHCQTLKPRVEAGAWPVDGKHGGATGRRASRRSSPPFRAAPGAQRARSGDPHRRAGWRSGSPLARFCALQRKARCFSRVRATLSLRTIVADLSPFRRLVRRLATSTRRGPPLPGGEQPRVACRTLAGAPDSMVYVLHGALLSQGKRAVARVRAGYYLGTSRWVSMRFMASSVSTKARKVGLCLGAYPPRCYLENHRT